MLGAVTLLLSCQLAGEVLVRLIGLPLPGPVLGMVFLFLYLLLRHQVPVAVEQVSNRILDHLSLLFVPAGVGVIQYAARIEDAWMAILASVVGGTVVAIAATAWILERLLPPVHRPPEEER